MHSFDVEDTERLDFLLKSMKLPLNEEFRGLLQEIQDFDYSFNKKRQSNPKAYNAGMDKYDILYRKVNCYPALLELFNDGFR